MQAADAFEAIAETPLEIHGETVMISRTSCHCGGDYAWMRQRLSGAWEMVGCVCHNPALGV